jgi:PPP family 3-phenylpropionic acid transporter
VPQVLRHNCFDGTISLTRNRATASTPWMLRAIFVAIGLSTASVAPFVPVILKARGLDPASIGVVAAVGALATTVVVPVWGHLADAALGRRRTFQLGLLIAACTAGALLAQLPIVAAAGLFAGFTVYAGLFLGLGDALAVADLPSPERQYGALRALASLSFTVGVVAVGLLYSWAGYGVAPAVFLVWAGGLLVFVSLVPDHGGNAAARASAKQAGRDRPVRFGSIGRAFAVQPRLWSVLAMFTLAFAGVQAGVTFLGIRIVELGGQPSDVALSFGLSAVTEIPGLVGAGWMGRRFGLRWLFVASLILYGLCIASWGILPSVIAINATRLVTGVSFGSLTAARVLLIPRLLPDTLQATGQVLVQAASVGFGSVMGSVIGGVIYGSVGPTFFFPVASGAAIAGAIAAWFVLAGPVGARLAGRAPDPPQWGSPPSLL